MSGTHLTQKKENRETTKTIAQSATFTHIFLAFKSIIKNKRTAITGKAKQVNRLMVFKTIPSITNPTPLTIAITGKTLKSTSDKT